mmetsp:Transcript_36687/g.91379  ORF Transcript_36687/g.91379 Transcript_36687/m.91379 type:complete len:239 (+) Transcript_36687:259-975(+)
MTLYTLGGIPRLQRDVVAPSRAGSGSKTPPPPPASLVYTLIFLRASSARYLVGMPLDPSWSNLRCLMVSSLVFSARNFARSLSPSSRYSRRSRSRRSSLDAICDCSSSLWCLRISIVCIACCTSSSSFCCCASMMRKNSSCSMRAWSLSCFILSSFWRSRASERSALMAAWRPAAPRSFSRYSRSYASCMRMARSSSSSAAWSAAFSCCARRRAVSSSFSRATRSFSDSSPCSRASFS